MKRVVITGVSRGLGRDLLRRFSTGNYEVYGILRNKSDYAKLQSLLTGNARLILADLSSDDSISSIQASIGDQAIDLLINNAGIGGSATNIADVETSEIAELFNIHCLGVVRTVSALRSNLQRSETPVVINLNSRFGSIGRQNSMMYQELEISYSYRIAKAAQNMLTVSLRNEFKGDIRFISLHPGKMKTKIASVDADVESEHVADQIFRFYESGPVPEVNGIVQIEDEIIEW